MSLSWKCEESPSERHKADGRQPPHSQFATCHYCGATIKRAHLRSTSWFTITPDAPTQDQPAPES